jgi:hypothetical protein
MGGAVGGVVFPYGLIGNIGPTGPIGNMDLQCLIGIIILTGAADGGINTGTNCGTRRKFRILLL